MWDRPEALNAIANALFGVAFLLVLYGSFVVVVRLPIFPLGEVRLLEAPKHLRSAEIEAVLRKELHGTFFTIDLGRVRKGFEALAWVRRADVRRHWPDRLEVRLEEHVPLARWGTMGFVNVQGEVFNAPYEAKLPT